MKNRIIGSLISKIKSTNKYDETKILEIKYGLEALYLNITKTIVILCISLLLHTFKELLLFLIFFGLIRLNAFGLHAHKSYQCWITSVPVFSLVPYLIKNINISCNIVLALSLLSLIIISCYAPADTEKRPLIRKNKRFKFKLLSIITSILYILLIIIYKNNYLNSIILYSLLLESILIIPISYKIFGLKYNNYLNYKVNI